VATTAWGAVTVRTRTGTLVKERDEKVMDGIKGNSKEKEKEKGTNRKEKMCLVRNQRNHRSLRRKCEMKKEHGK